MLKNSFRVAILSRHLAKVLILGAAPYVLSLFILSMAGCAQTIINPAPADQKVEDLAALQTRILKVHIPKFPENYHLGHQYVGLIFPAGDIYLRSLSESLIPEIRQEFALAGWDAMVEIDPPVVGSTPPIETLENVSELAITNLAISLTAFDYVFTRKIVCDIDSTVTFSSSIENSIPLVLPVSASSSTYSRMAFYPELENALHECLKTYNSQLGTLVNGA